MLRRCSIVLLLALPLLAAAQEVCNNGIDDDNDGLVDLNDPDCPCSLMISPGNVPSFIPNPSFEERTCCPYSYSNELQPYFSTCCVDWDQATVATSDYYHECGFYPPTFPVPPPDGVAFLGMITTMGDWIEYVGTNLTASLDPHPLLPGTTYTLSLWVALFGATGGPTGGVGSVDMATYGVVYHDPFPLAIFGHGTAVPFPVGTYLCIGDMPGWTELGRVYHTPNGLWEHVSITFTPTEEIDAVIIGAACDTPPSYTPSTVMGPNGVEVGCMPYTLVDDLMLTEAVDQVFTPVTSMGDVCHDNVVVTAVPPAGATGHQWYLNGVAIPGQTGLTLNASSAGLEGGAYTLASDFQGQCLMGLTHVIDQVRPEPAFAIAPTEGCAPLEITFRDTTDGNVASRTWDLGPLGTSSDATVVRTYTAPGTYDVTLTVTNDAGCSADSTLNDAIVVHPVPDATITATPPITDTEHTTVDLSGSGNDIVSWWWDLGAVPPNTSADQDLTVAFPDAVGEYPVMLVVANGFGCRDTVRSVVTVTLEGVIVMPNVFSPNGDHRNDAFIPLNYTGTPGRMDIYNRWGQLIFSTTRLSTGWDGRAEGGPVPEGTYYYVVKELTDEGTVTAGYLTLVR